MTHRQRITRRQALPTLAALPAAMMTTSQPDAWIRSNSNGHDLRRLVGDLAQWERDAVQSTYPRKWHRMSYVTVNDFRPGSSLVVGLGRISEAKESHAAILAALSANAVDVLAVGWSRDRRAWSLFAKADADAVRCVMPGRVEFYCSVCNAAWPQFTEFCPRCKTHWDDDGTGLKDFPQIPRRKRLSTC